jgi:hypothetical protein
MVNDRRTGGKLTIGRVPIGRVTIGHVTIGRVTIGRVTISELTPRNVVAIKLVAGKPGSVTALAPVGPVEAIRAALRGFRPRTSTAFQSESELRRPAPEMQAYWRYGMEPTSAEPQAF